MHRGQAIVETVIAILLIMAIFSGAYGISRKLEALTLLDHAAARAARAKAVGFNDFMCEKSARVAMIPVAGRRLWPEEGGFAEVSRVPIYLSSEDEALANGVLEYEYWPRTAIDIRSGAGLSAAVEVAVDLTAEEIEASGRAACEAHYPFYMNDGGF